MQRTGVLGLLAVVLALGLPGCILEPTCDDPRSAKLATPWVDGAHLYTDTSQPWDTLLRIDAGQAHGDWSVTPKMLPSDWGLEEETLGRDGDVELRRLRVHPGEGDGTLAVRNASVVELEGYCTTGSSSSVTWDLASPWDGTSASPGQGAHVMTAGFWENGTLFYTNIAAIDQDPAWPKADWYAWEGGEPLPVYVYDQDRSEEPIYWHGTTYGTPLGPPTKDLTLWDYYTTIPGFNEGLKGLSDHTTRVVHLTPEQAYTRPGNEAHPLYGDALVFYIKVLDVVDLPCPFELDAELCTTPFFLA